MSISPSKSYTAIANQTVQADLTRRCITNENYIKKLEGILQEHGIELPEDHPIYSMNNFAVDSLLKEGTAEELEGLTDHTKELMRSMDVSIEFLNLSYVTEVAVDRQIPTVFTILASMVNFWKPVEKKRIDILANVSGRILPRKMTLLIGPPGSGKSVLLKALGGRLRPLGGAKFSGEVYYDGDNISSGKFLIGKVSDYVEQGDTHEAVLTVEETLKFSWLSTTAGSHSYALAKDEAAAEALDTRDDQFVEVHNTLVGLGLTGCKDTYVGNDMIRGISGGQKRRVTIGEMMVCPRPVKLMDCISNGLDTATTYDIIRSIRIINQKFGTTNVLSLLQPPPDVYNLFDEIILLNEGHIIYHGPRDQIISYFEELGYSCPPSVDQADFLQELPTEEGKRFITREDAPRTAIALANAWKASKLHVKMMSEMRYKSVEDAKSLEATNDKLWYDDQKQTFAGGFWFYLKLLFDRQMKVVTRDATFALARVGQSLIIGAIAGSLFSNIRTQDMNTLNGFLFNTMLFSALGGFSILPIVYDQKAVYFKQKDALFFPTWIYCLAQVVSLIPLQILEAFIYVSINYWSAGLASNYNGSRFFTFIVLSIIFGMVINQVFRLIAMFVPTMGQALPVSGLCFIAMILFSGFIQPKSLISDGWSWFYWLNPTAWALKSVTINELKAPKYDFATCTSPDCSTTARFGDYVLEQYEIPTDEKYIWYSFAVLVAEFFFLFVCSVLAMKYIRTEPVPLPPLRKEEDEININTSSSLAVVEEGKSGQLEMMPTSTTAVQPVEPSSSSKSKSNINSHNLSSSKRSSRVSKAMLPYEPITFGFKDIWYTVTLPKGHTIDLLQGVSGYFEPGTVTALMGSSGAGKTTLLDVLAGRKNTGVVKGEMYLNGVPKVEGYFRKVMGYVEQFDSLSVKATAREIVEFSAALRLASDISRDQRDAWVNAVLEMMDLEDIQDELIGSEQTGGMSFEQRKRVSIAVELAANPSVLFLDEPTTGLDSRAAQNVVKNIRTIAASGRTVVCTIHQPSAVIFESFDQLLLLKKGGQTVFFGPLGANSRNLVDFFEMAPNVTPLTANVNPATWMLDVIGAGTAVQVTGNETDFHAHYNASTLHQLNMEHLQVIITPNESSQKILDAEKVMSQGATAYNASYFRQFVLLFTRFATTYWRTPSYSLVRHVTMIFIALIFASAYPRQNYHNYVAVISRAAVIYITAFFCGILSMILATPVIIEERPVFYREQQSRMYAVFIYVLTLVCLEIPYLLLSSLSFTLPFFYIVGFDNVGAKIAKFFWFWLFNFLVQAVFLCFGIFFVALAPNEATTHVLGGLTNSLMGLFCGFLISEQNYPPFWTFMYWLNPVHYAIEGSIMTMFHGDTTMIRLMDNSDATAETYITKYAFTTWSYDNVGYDIMALCLFCFATLMGTYLCLSYMRHDKR